MIEFQISTDKISKWKTENNFNEVPDKCPGHYSKQNPLTTYLILSNSAKGIT